ncbi:hypothetical protein BSQ40_07935 [Serratia fonticola]|nr:hypothetical protein BSQ40_07935 [Serratia fonticola]
MYADQLDQASELEQFNIQVALNSRQHEPAPSPICLNGDCGEPSVPGTNFFCKECREDNERHQWSLKNRRVA